MKRIAFLVLLQLLMSVPVAAREEDPTVTAAFVNQPGPDDDEQSFVHTVKNPGTERCIRIANEMTWIIGDMALSCVRPDQRHLYGTEHAGWNRVAGWFQGKYQNRGEMFVVDDPAYDEGFLRAVFVHEYGHAVDWSLNQDDFTSCWYTANNCLPYSLEPYAREYAWLYSEVQYRDGYRVPQPVAQSFTSWHTKLQSGYYGELRYQRDIRRLYLAMFRREPDAHGAIYWTARLASGTSTKQIGQFFSQSGEFYRLYGDLSHADYVARLYLNVLGRAADGAGHAYWTHQLTSHRMTRGEVLAYFADSPEFRRLTS